MSAGTQQPLSIEKLYVNWDENQVTWQNKPVGQPLASTYTWDGVYHEIAGASVDALIQNWIQNPASNFGIIVGQTTGTTYQIVYSDDAAPDQRPMLIFDVNSTPPEALLEYKFNEVGSSATNTGSLGTDANGAMLEAPSPSVSADLHTGSGGGLSSVSTDRAFDNTAAGAMGTAGNNTGGFIKVDDNDALDGLKSFTIMMWLKGQDNLTGNATLVSKSNGSNGFVLSVVNDRLRLTVNGISVDSAQFLETKNKWCMVAACYNGESTVNNVRFYVGADYDTSTMLLSTASLAGEDSIGNTAPLLIGNDSQFGSPFDGLIDNVRIFADPNSSSAALISDQIEPYRQADLADAPGAGNVIINVYLGESLGQVEQRVFGVCGINQPFNTPLINKFAPMLEDSSLRVWWSDLYFAYSPSTMTTDDLIFGTSAETYLMNPYTTVDDNSSNWQAVYTDVNNNNLGQRWWWQTPEGQADIIDRVNIRNDYPHFGIKRFEIWNEPQHPQNGSWEADDYARYVIDCSYLAKQKDPSIEIGACLTETELWNNDMLSYLIAQGKGNAITFCIDHSYNWQWWQVSDQNDQYYTKVFQTGDQARRMRGLRNLLDSYGYGWELAVTEWNIHPTFDYSGDKRVARDLGAALFQASTLQKYLEEGVDTATVFQLRSDSNEHFGMVADGDANTVRPPFYVFDWYDRYFNGVRCETDVRSPATIWSFPGNYAPAIPNTLSPYVEAATAYDSNSRQTCIMIVNKHLTDSMHVVLKINGNGQFLANADVATLNASDVWSDVPVVSQSYVSGNNNSFTLDMPAHSLTMLQMPTIDLYIFTQNWLQSLPCDEYLAGDLNNDCSVNFIDLAIFAQSWFQ